ncbi:MAG: sulfurtransferase TusA family protein [Candidatus Hodarchaeales archaeon]|jgi:tRNA 2-thiouridine synthesizing protein A
MPEVHKTLDARKLNCPMVVIKSKKALQQLEIGKVLEILASDPGSWNDVPAWIRATKQELVNAENLGPKDYRYFVKRLY